MENSLVKLELQRLRIDAISPPQQCFPFLAPIRFTAESPELTQDRLTSLLSIVYEFLLANPIDYESDPDSFSIDNEFWRSMLPDWFLRVTPFETTAIGENAWTVDGWLYWFISPAEERAWLFYDLDRNGCDFTLQVEVEDLPFANGALKWAIIAAGANPNSIEVC